jgi:hypothetical protein
VTTTASTNPPAFRTTRSAGDGPDDGIVIVCDAGVNRCISTRTVYDPGRTERNVKAPTASEVADRTGRLLLSVRVIRAPEMTAPSSSTTAPEIDNAS